MTLFFFYFGNLTKTKAANKIAIFSVVFLLNICCVYAQISDKKHLEQQLYERLESAIELNLDGDLLDADTTELKEVARLCDMAAYTNGSAQAHRYIGDYYVLIDQVVKAVPHYHQVLKSIQGLDSFTVLRIKTEQRIATML